MYTALQHYMYIIVYCIFIQHTNTCTCTCNVSPRIRWGSTSVVHDVWLTMFNWCHKTVINRIREQGQNVGVVPWYHPLGETLCTYMYIHMTVQCTCKNNIYLYMESTVYHFNISMFVKFKSIVSLNICKHMIIINIYMYYKHDVMSPLMSFSTKTIHHINYILCV